MVIFRLVLAAPFFVVAFSIMGVAVLFDFAGRAVAGLGERE